MTSTGWWPRSSARVSTSRSSGRRCRSWRGSSMRSPPAAIAAFGPSAAAAGWRARRRSPRTRWKRPGCRRRAGRGCARWRRGSTPLRELTHEPGSPGAGVVIKADGLAAGKGVTVADTREQAEGALGEIFVEGRFGAERPTTPGRGRWSRCEASAVVEERLVGEELSLLALCDGERALALAPARDFKRIGEGDEGPNTGGMGSYSPVAGFDEARVEEIVASRPPADRRSDARARHALPRDPLRRPDAHARRACACSSTTCASAIPRPRRCCRGCARTCSTCCSRASRPGGLEGVQLGVVAATGR